MYQRTQISGLMVAAALALTYCQPLSAQEVSKPPAPSAAEHADDEQLIIKVYNVADLVRPIPNYPFRSTVLPLADFADRVPAEGTAALGGAAGGAGMSMTGGYPGGGFGMLGGDEEAPATGKTIGSTWRFGSPFDQDDLAELLGDVVDSDSWDFVGGPAIVKVIGNLLVILQTPSAHERIDALLADIRAEADTARPVNIRADWLFLEARQLKQMSLATQQNKPAGNVMALDRKALAELDAEVRLCYGQITCFDGQTVHLISGRGRTVVKQSTPVVAENAIAYDPNTVLPHLGAMLQITPSLSPGDKTAVVHVQSVVTQWTEPADTKTGQQTEPRIDRIGFVAHQLFTSLRMPLNTPVVVGGMTLDPDRENRESKELFLVMEIRALVP